MLPVLQIGPLAMQTSGLVIIFGVWLGFTLSERFARYHHIQFDLVDRIGVISVVAFLVGGRLAFFSRYPEAFLTQPLSFFSLSLTMFDITGGVFICLIAAAVTVQVRRLNGWQVLDAFTPLIMVLHTTIWLANLASGEAYGLPAKIPWRIEIWGAQRHPVQAYFFILSGIISGIFLFRGGLYQRFMILKDGSRFMAAIFFIALSWVAFSPYLSQGELLANKISLVQLTGWIIALVCLLIFAKLNIHLSTNNRSGNG